MNTPSPGYRQARRRRPADLQLADRLHSAAIHLLRRVRVADAAAGLTAPRLSALSVLVFRGPLPLSALAAAEQVRPPTITRLVQELERSGLVERLPDPTDRRVTRVRATSKGRRLLHQGRLRRIQRLAEALAPLSRDERRVVGRAVAILESVIGTRRTTTGSGRRHARGTR